MAYQQALGSTAAGDWNSTKYPGTCKPTNFTALGVARDLQAQLNRLAQGLGLSKIKVDGDIGPGTLKLLDQIRKKALPTGGDPTKALLNTAYTSCTSVAYLAPSLTLAAKRLADERSVPATVSQPAPSAPVTIVTPQGAEVAAPPEMQSSYSPPINLGGVSMSPLLILVGGGLAYYLYTERKGKRSAASSSGSRRASRRTTRRASRRTSRR